MPNLNERLPLYGLVCHHTTKRKMDVALTFKRRFVENMQSDIKLP